MSKSLAEQPWKALVGKHKLKDPGLLKLLGAYRKADPKKDAAGVAKLLADIEGTAVKLRKTSSGNKEVAAYLDTMLKDVKKEQQTVRALADAAAKAAEKEAREKAKQEEAAKKEQEKKDKAQQTDEDEDDSDGNALLTTEYLTRILKKVKIGGAKKSYAAMVCVAKPELGLLIAPNPKKRLTGPHKTLIRKHSGGTKVFAGRVSFEDGQLTFLLEVAPTGIAKKLRKTVKSLTGLSWRVQVKGPDGAVDADGEPDEDEAGAATGAAATNEPGSAVAEGDEEITLPGVFLDPVRTLVDKLRNSTLGDLVEDAVERLQDEIVDAERKIVSGGTKVAKALVDALQSGIKQVAKDASEIGRFEKQADAVRKALAALRKHPAKAHIQGEIQNIERLLAEAVTLSRTGKLADAKKKLQAAAKAAADAKGFADKYQAYLKERAAAVTLVHDMKGMYGDPADYQDLVQAVVDADALAAPPTRDYAGATAAVRQVATTMSSDLTRWYSTSRKKSIAELKKLGGADFVKEEIAAIEKAQAEVDKNLKAKDWRRVILAAKPIGGQIVDARKAATRRVAYDAQRPKTVAALAKVKGFASLKDRHDALAEQLKQADEQASLAGQQFEIGLDSLKRIEKECTELAARGPDADAYAKERPAADKAFGDLSKHGAAATQRKVLDGISTQLARAAELAKDPAQAKQALEDVRAAAKDIATAEKAFDDALRVSSTTGAAKDAAGVTKAVETLEKDAAECAKSKHKDTVTKELRDLQKALAVAKALAAKKDGKKAVAALKIAGDRLIGVQAALAQQEGWPERYAALERRHATVSKEKEAKAVKARVDAATKALADVDKKHKARDWGARAKAVGAADDALDAAERDVAARRAYDAAQSQLDADVKAATLDRKQQTAVAKEISAAKKKADACDFAAAQKGQAKASSMLEGYAIEAAAKTSPPDKAKIQAAAAKIMKNGNGKDLDALISKLPDDTPYDVLPVLAKERFGVELKTDPDSSAPEANTRTGKRMLRMLAMVPDDVVGNPSLKTVERRDPAKNGGFYRSSEDLVVMNGRPGQAAQGFGSAIANQLPDDVEADCKPANERSVDYFDYATLHEVGHSVDDNLRFMDSREGQAQFGGWRKYGANVDPIAKAVADWAGYNTTKEQLDAVLGLVLGRQVEWPEAPSGKEAEWRKAKKKVADWHALATNSQIWWQQSNSDKIAINGTVYQEAYKNDWVSYDAKARKQAITGYQFRAPGEWFAELYASYRIGKLKPTHPAVKWLSKIQI